MEPAFKIWEIEETDEKQMGPNLDLRFHGKVNF
jgi:hypothetical protein